jgi:hypothetical protein
MEGPARAPRFAAVQRSFTPTRFSEDTLLSVYDRVLQVRSTREEVSAALEENVFSCAAPVLVLTGGQHV